MDWRGWLSKRREKKIRRLGGIPQVEYEFLVDQVIADRDKAIAAERDWARRKVRHDKEQYNRAVRLLLDAYKCVHVRQMPVSEHIEVCIRVPLYMFQDFPRSSRGVEQFFDSFADTISFHIAQELLRRYTLWRGKFPDTGCMLEWPDVPKEARPTLNQSANVAAGCAYVKGR